MTASAVVASRQFSGLELVLLWESVGRDRLPFPLSVRLDVSTAEELDTLRRTTQDNLADLDNEYLQLALDALVNPFVSVEVCGFIGAKRETMLRMYGAVGDRDAALMYQAPGPDHSSGGDVMIYLVRRDSLASLIASGLPDCAAGTRPGFSVYESDIDPEPGTSFLQRPNEVSAGERVRKFFRRRRTSIGEIACLPGGGVDNRPGEGVSFHWSDYEGDGRYIISRSDQVTIIPAGEAEMGQQIRRAIEAAMARGH